MELKIDRWEEGFAIWKNVLTKKECEAYIDLFEDYADKDFSPIVDIEKKSEDGRFLIKEDLNLFEAVRETTGWEPTSIGSMFHFKKPGTKYALQAWQPHQDNSYTHAPQGKIATAILCLNDADLGNGGLCVWPGSHVEKILPFVRGSSKTLKPGNKIRKIPEKYKAELLELKQGELFIMDANLIHSSFPNWSNKQRAMLGIMFVEQGTKYELGRRRR